MADGMVSDTFGQILRQAEIPGDGALIVHSAIASLSRAGFRAEAIIETLLDRLPDGTLLMPTMTWRTVTPTNPHWDELQTPSHTGVLSEIFRKDYATARSIHPTHSVAGVGRDIEMLLSRHHLDDTPVSCNSPYGLLHDRETFILMIGVGLENVTAIHMPEELIAPEIYLRPPSETESYHCRDRHARTHLVRTRRHRRLNRDFPKFGRPLRQSGELQTGVIADCPYQLVRLRALLRAVTIALEKNAHATLRDGDNASAA